MTAGPRYIVQGNAVGWLQMDATAVSRVRVWDEESAADEAFSSGTYQLVKPDGTDAIASTAISGATGLVEESVTLASTDTPGRYQEQWTFTVTADSAVYKMTRTVGVANVPVVPMATTQDIIERDPLLATYPTGQTSWRKQLESAWETISAWALDHPSGPSAWTTSHLKLPHLLLAMSYAYRVYGTFSGDSYRLEAARLEAEARKELERMPAQLDTDADGDLDDSNYETLPLRGPKPWRRRG